MVGGEDGADWEVGDDADVSLSLPLSPLWHHRSKQWLPWNTKVTADASSRGVCGGGGGQTALQYNRIGCF